MKIAMRANRPLRSLFQHRCLSLLDELRYKTLSITLVSHGKCFASASSHTIESRMRKLMNEKQYEKALNLFHKQSDVSTTLTINMAIKACTQLRDFKTGFDIQRKLSPQSLNDPYIQTSLIHFYMQAHRVDCAYDLFNSIANKSNPMYAAMIKGLTTNRLSEKALDLFEEMTIEPDKITFVVLLNACAKAANDQAKTVGKRLVQQVLTHHRNDVFVLNSTIYMLMKFGDVESAENIFNSMKNKDKYSYGAMMKGYAENNHFDKVLDLYEQMSSHSKPDHIIYVIVLNACTRCSHDRAKQIGKEILQHLPDTCPDEHVLLTSGLNMLMNVGDVSAAESLFRAIRKRDIISYGAIMHGYRINDQPLKCFEAFEQLKQDNLVPDETIFSILFGTCSDVSILSRCERIYNEMPSYFKTRQRIQNALIHMWGKSGTVDRAYEVFKLVSHPDIITTTSMINAYGLNGMGAEAVRLYGKIPLNERNEVSQICTLNACSHSGLLNEAWNIFNEINVKTEKITTTMVDCLSRLFLFDEAQHLIENYEKTSPPSVVMYMAILSGLRNHRNIDLSEKIYHRMKSIFPNDKHFLASGAILLANIYSSLGEHQQGKYFRSNQLKDLKQKTKIGLSWTEVNNELVQFKAHDMSHPRSSDIHAEADRLSAEITAHGYKFDSSWITRPLAEYESFQSVLCGHSERLAIAFNFIQQPVPTIIQITKNIRVCGDCHEATRLIAKIRQRDIIVRDANRVHHFHPNGKCSCQGHF